MTDENQDIECPHVSTLTFKPKVIIPITIQACLKCGYATVKIGEVIVHEAYVPAAILVGAADTAIKALSEHLGFERHERDS